MNIYKYLFVLIGIALAMPMRGEERVSKDTFEQMVDYVNATVVGNYLNAAATPALSAIKNVDIDTPISYNELVDLISNNKEAAIVTAFCKKVDGVKKSYKENLTVEQLLALLFPMDKDKAFYEAKGPEKLKKIKDTVSDYLKKKAISSQVEENSSKDNANEKAVEDSEQPASSGGGKSKERNVKDNPTDDIPSKKDESGLTAVPLWSILPILISMLACVVGFILYRRNSALEIEVISLKGKLDMIESKIARGLGSTKEAQQKSMNSNSANKLLESRVNELQMSHANLSRSIEKIEKKLEQEIAANPDGNVGSADEQQKLERPKKEAAYTSIYVITPYEGSFGNPSTQYRSNHNYEIRILPNAANEGELYTLNSVDSVKRYLNDPEMIVNPVCEATTAFNPLAIRVATVKPGRVVLVNDRWVIQEKIMIAYE